MLTAQELSIQAESKHHSSNVIAKLMGLEALPLGQPSGVAQRSDSKGYSQNTHPQLQIPLDCWKNEVHHFLEQNDYKDFYEVLQQSVKASFVRDASLQKMGKVESMNEKKMSIICQKFIEARRMSTDETLCQSDEFQDALGIFNSNKELFLSIFSRHLYEVPYSTPQTKRITVLRPSKIVDSDTVSGSVKNSEQQANKLVQVEKEIGWDKSTPQFPPSFASWKVGVNPKNSQTTQIVVLKPCFGETRDIKAKASLAKISTGGDFSRSPVDDEPQKLKVPNEYLHCMDENITGHRRDEALHSSVFSNGCIGDERSVCISENEYEVGNLSDSDYFSASSRHAWDHINDSMGNHHSSSSFGRASNSPESPVGREAKKRISERWAMMASNKSFQKQKHAKVSSSTLGEMLALSDTREALKSDEGISKEQESTESSACLNGNFNNDNAIDNSPRNFLRSRSIPVTSTVYGPSINVAVLGSDISRTFDSGELCNRKKGKSSFRGKVSNLFRSRNKKIKEKILNSPSKDESSFVRCCSDTSPCANNNGPEENMLPHLNGSACRIPSPDLIGIKLSQGVVSRESVSLATEPGTPTENQEQPSPVSVLVPPFEENDSATREYSSCSKQDYWGTLVPSHVAKSKLIDKASLVERMAPRALSWDEEATPRILKPHSASPIAAEEEQDWHFLIQTLLFAAGLDNEVNSISFFARWHSPKCPLGPSLRKIYVSHDDKVPMFEAKRRERRSNRKLVFDCVNAALVDITWYEFNMCSRTTSCSGESNGPLQGSPLSLADQVWAWMKERCMSEVAGEEGDGNSLAVEWLVWNDVLGEGWNEGMRREVDGVGQEIGGKLLDDLLEEAVFGLTDNV